MQFGLKELNPPLGTIIIRLGGLLFEKESPKSYSKGLRETFLCRLEVYRTAIFRNFNHSHNIIHITIFTYV